MDPGTLLTLGLMAWGFFRNRPGASAVAPVPAAAAPPTSPSGATPSAELTPSDVPQPDPYNLGGGPGFVTSSQPAATIDGVRSGPRVSGLSGDVGGGVDGGLVVQTGPQVVASTPATQAQAANTTDSTGALSVSPASLVRTAVQSGPRVYSLLTSGTEPAAPEVSGPLSISQVAAEPAAAPAVVEVPGALTAASPTPIGVVAPSALIPSAEVGGAAVPVVEVGALGPTAEVGATAAGLVPAAAAALEPAAAEVLPVLSISQVVGEPALAGVVGTAEAGTEAAAVGLSALAAPVGLAAFAFTMILSDQLNSQPSEVAMKGVFARAVRAVADRGGLQRVLADATAELHALPSVSEQYYALFNDQRVSWVAWTLAGLWAHSDWPGNPNYVGDAYVPWQWFDTQLGTGASAALMMWYDSVYTPINEAYSTALYAQQQATIAEQMASGHG